jgi:hypothetical protein
MSDHFLKYSVLASYLRTRLDDRELIDALRLHFPPYNQMFLASASLSRLQQATDLLKELEMIEGNDER